MLKEGTVVLFNNFGYLFKLNLDNHDWAYIGKRYIDIKVHNKLTPAERNRWRDDPTQSPLLFIPPATPEELVAAEYFYQPLSSDSDAGSHKDNSHLDEEEDNSTTHTVCPRRRTHRLLLYTRTSPKHRKRRLQTISQRWLPSFKKESCRQHGIPKGHQSNFWEKRQ